MSGPTYGPLPAGDPTTTPRRSIVTEDSTPLTINSLMERVKKLENESRITSVPGIIAPFGSQTIPEGWLECNGQQVEIARYPALYAVVGATFNPLTPSTTSGYFRVPDLRGRVPMGVGQARVVIENLTTHALTETTPWSMHNIAEKSGDERTTISTAELPAHNHGATTSVTLGNDNADHSHTLTGFDGRSYAAGSTMRPIFNVGGAANWALNAFDAIGGESANHQHTATASTTIANSGSNQPHYNLQPYTVVTFIIRY